VANAHGLLFFCRDCCWSGEGFFLTVGHSMVYSFSVRRRKDRLLGCELKQALPGR